jgi:hypothetical protein
MKSSLLVFHTKRTLFYMTNGSGMLIGNFYLVPRCLRQQYTLFSAIPSQRMVIQTISYLHRPQNGCQSDCESSFCVLSLKTYHSWEGPLRFWRDLSHKYQPPAVPQFAQSSLCFVNYFKASWSGFNAIYPTIVVLFDWRSSLHLAIIEQSLWQTNTGVCREESINSKCLHLVQVEFNCLSFQLSLKSCTKTSFMRNAMTVTRNSP